MITYFDAHLHIIDPRFPLTANQEYLSEPFTCEDYRRRAAAFNVIGGCFRGARSATTSPSAWK